MKTIFMAKQFVHISVIAVILFAFICYFSDSADAQIRKSPNNAFNYGERLDYKVGYSFIIAGNGYFQIMPMVGKYNERRCYDIRFRVYSLESLKWIYQVDDAYRSLVDEEGIFPWMFQQRIREGKYQKDAKATFDQVNNMAYEGDKSYKVPPYVHDIVSAFYYVRTQDIGKMKNGTIFYLENFYNKKSNKLGVKIHGRQTIQVEAGKFNTILIEPLVVDGGLFKSEGNIFIWVTDDEMKIPVKVSTKIVIGDVYAELTKYSGLCKKLTSKIG